MRSGISKDRDCPLKEVGKCFGISRERVRQIERAVLGVSLHRLRRDANDDLQEIRSAQNSQKKVRRSKANVSLIVTSRQHSIESWR
jgi:hypothetical protein